MKTVILTLCILVVSVAQGRAEDSAMAAMLTVSTHTISAGVVNSVSWADPIKGTKSEIVVMDATKNPTHILVTSTTTLWDADAKAIMPDKIVVRSRVNIIYLTTSEGINIAKSIKILK